MKKSFACILSLIMIFGLSSCRLFDKSQSLILPAAKAVYPESIAFDDTEARMVLWNANPLQPDFTEGVKGFSYDTASLLLSNASVNVAYCPLSLYYSLALASTGANGATKDEFLTLLGAANSNELSSQCGNLYRLLYTNNKMDKLIIANSIWMQKETKGSGILFNPTFMDNAVKNFYASLYSVDFADGKTGKAMSQWVADNTNGALSPDFPLSGDTIMTLLNTVSYHSQWTDKFDEEKTAPDTFYLSSGETVTADFMNSHEGASPIYDGDGFLRAPLTMKDGNEMIFILPDAGVSVADLVATPEKVREIFEGGEYFNSDITFHVPKFSADSDFDMIAPLKTLGISSAFAEDADFSGMSNADAYISGIRQQTHFAIDEKGVDASSYTQIDYAGAAIPTRVDDMNLNRPFIYGITATDGTLLFMGVCENPAA